MAEPNKPGSGAMFRNDKKTADNHPDFRGRFTDPDGKEWELSAWARTATSGTAYLSLSIKEPYTKPADQPAASADDFLTPTAAPAQAAEPLTFDSSKQPTGDLPF